MIFMSLDVLEAEAELDKHFQTPMTEDRAYELSMLVYDDEEIAIQRVKAIADSKNKK